MRDSDYVSGGVMKVRRLLAVTAAVKSNADMNTATDIYQLARDLQTQFPDLCQKELVRLIEQAVVTVGGAAFWDRPAANR